MSGKCSQSAHTIKDKYGVALEGPRGGEGPMDCEESCTETQEQQGSWNRWDCGRIDEVWSSKTDISCLVWDEEVVPDDWAKGLICTI